MNTQLARQQQPTSSINVINKECTINLNRPPSSDYRKVVRRRRRKRETVRIDLSSDKGCASVVSSNKKVIKTNIINIDNHRRWNFVRNASNDINFKRTEINSRRDKIRKDIEKYANEMKTLEFALDKSKFIRNKIEHKIDIFKQIIDLLRKIDKEFRKIFFASFHSTNRERRTQKYLVLEKELIGIKKLNKRLQSEQRIICEKVFHSKLETCVLCSGVEDEFSKV